MIKKIERCISAKGGMRSSNAKMNAINSNILAIMELLRLPLTDKEKAPHQLQLEKHLDALDLLSKPVDRWGRSEAQQKEDRDNLCCCISPKKTSCGDKCCSSCGFWFPEEFCECCGNFGRCAAWCEDDEAYWELRTYQTCRDCGVYVLGLSEHKKTCANYLWKETHCDECGELHPHAAVSGRKRCWCAYDQDDLNKMDLVNRRGF